MAIVGAIAAVGTAAAAGYSTYENVQAHADQRKAQRLQERQAEIANVRARQQAIAKNVQEQAIVQAGAVARGSGAGSSGSAGESASLGSQLGTNLGFQAEEIGLGKQVASFQEAANQAESNASIATAIGNLPGQLGIEPQWSFQNGGKKG